MPEPTYLHMSDIPDDPVSEWGIDTVKRKFVNEYEAYHDGRTDGVLHLTLLNRLYDRLQAENIDVDALLEKKLPNYTA